MQSVLNRCGVRLFLLLCLLFGYDSSCVLFGAMKATVSPAIKKKKLGVADKPQETKQWSIMKRVLC